ncbi:MAG: SRPBCC family protein [Bacteroidia bacterium]
MKALKIILGVVVGIIVIILAIGLSAPKKAVVERSVNIAAPASTVWNNVKSLEAQHNWSPWAKRDTGMTISYKGETGKVGSKYTWQGNEQVGQGYQTITAINDGNRIEQDLVFTGDWESEAVVWIEVMENGEEQKVTWGFKTEYDFVSSIFMMFMDMESFLGKDFSEGLGYLKDICEKQAMNEASAPKTEEFTVNGIKITELQFGPKTYISHKETVKFPDIQAFFAKYLPEIMGNIQAAGYELDGMPSAIYYNWDEENQQTEVAAAIPIKGLGVQMGGYETITVHPGLACQVQHYGSYDSLSTVHGAIETHLANRTLTGTIAIEEYVTDPTTVKDLNELLTVVTYPITTVE